MSMSKRDYQAIARVINALRSESDEPAHGVVLDVADRLADMMLADNPRFDRARFIEACETGKTKGMPR